MRKQELYKALWEGEPSSFATGGELKLEMPASLEVQGLGVIKIPVSPEDLVKLQSVSEAAPFAVGEQNPLDSIARQAWQIPPHKLSFPDDPEFLTRTSYGVAASALAELGVDAADCILEVRPHRLLLNEPAGHFKFSRDTPQEDGVFATMIIQLPTRTGHEGGTLTVRHGDSTKTFDARSRTAYHYTLLFCDCKHQLSRITRGSRVSLVFNLVRRNTRVFPAENTAFFLASMPRVRSLLLDWAGAMQPESASYLIIPLGPQLGHSPSSDVCLPHDFSFSGLTGHDRVVAELVLHCDDFLEVHLSTFTERTEKYEIYEGPRSQHRMESWKTRDDACVDLGASWWCNWHGLGELMVQEIDKGDHDAFCESANYETDCFGKVKFYYVPALVVWPRSRRIEVLCSFNSLGSDKDCIAVANLVMEKHLPCLETPEARADLQEMIKYMVRNARRRRCTPGIGVQGWNLVFEWCCKAGLKESALELLRICNWRTDRVPRLLPMVEWEELKNAYGDHNLIPVRLLEELKSAGREGDAVELARLMVSRVNTLDVETVERLAKFCLSERGILESELRRLFHEAPLACLTSTAHLGGEECQKMLNDRVETMDHASKQALALAELAPRLEALGSHDAAVEFDKKLRDPVLPGVAVMELKADLALFFLFPYLDRTCVKTLLSKDFHIDEVKKFRVFKELMSMMRTMQDAAGLLGLKADQKATGAFAELCSFMIDIVTGAETRPAFLCSHYGSYSVTLENSAMDDYERGVETPRPSWEFDEVKGLIEMVVWLGDETLNDRIVCLLDEKTHLAWKLLRKESGFVLRVMGMGDSARKTLKRLAEGRVRHLMAGLEYGMEKIDESKYRMCGMYVEKLVKKPRLRRALGNFREKQWESHTKVEVCELEFLLSFSS